MLAKSEIESIQRLEDYGKTLDQVDLKLTDRFIGSMYVRQIVIPKGVFLTSRVYKRTYVDVMISGDITISDTNGEYRLTGYNVLEGTPGRKRAGVAHEDTVWLTIHDMVDIKTDDHEGDISFATLDEYKNYRVDLAQGSYEKFLERNDLLENTVRSESENEPVAEVLGEFVVSDSPIQGKGIFATRRYVSGEVVGRVAQNGAKTTLGRYTNHSDYPNAIISDDRLIMIHPIDRGHEIVINYNYSPRLQQ